MVHRFTYILFVAWFAYFAIPVVNAYGRLDGQIIQLCTATGVKVIFIEDLDEGVEAASSKHMSKHCPCVHFLLDTATTVKLPEVNHCPISVAIDSAHEISQAVVWRYFARAPPVINLHT